MDVLVETTTGTVRGVREQGIRVFRGIPFGEPPVGPMRFMPPIPRRPWDGVLDASAPGFACPQPHAISGRAVVREAQDEDCLNLNVWAPEHDGGRSRRPVIVWCHGGGYLSGSANPVVYDGSAFARSGAVFVGFNYRLGAFGSFASPEVRELSPAACNLMMLDHAAALRWVRENIAAFGGDPANVTIFGGSSGGSSVGFLLAMPAAAGLFRRAVMVSADIAPRALPVAERTSEALLERLRSTAGDGFDPRSVDQLRSLDPSRLIVDYAALRYLVGRHGQPYTKFDPVVDRVELPDHPVLTAERDSAGGHGGGPPPVDLLFGWTADELGGRYGGEVSAEKALGPRFLVRERGRAPRLPELTTLFPGTGLGRGDLESIYGDSLRRQGRPAEPLDVFAAAAADVKYLRPMQRLADAHARRNRVFAFRFSWPSPCQDGLGAFHAITMPFFFGLIRHPVWADGIGTDPPAALERDLHGAIMAFAATGDPSHDAIGEWPAYDASTRPVMDFGLPTSRIVLDPEGGRRRACTQVPLDFVVTNSP